MKHLHTLFLFLLLAVSAQAQTLEVVSFDPLPLDLDASTNFPKTDPQTGRLYAIIKVVAPGDGYNFDIGQLQLGPAVPHPEQNEIWVYVPEGTRKLKISHPQYGQLKSDSKDGYYWFPSVEKAKCYRIVLSVSGIEHKMGWLTFRCNANGAEVLLGQEKIAVGKIANGALQVPCTQGMRTFTIHKSRYADTTGTVWVGDSTHVEANLTPLFGRLSITTNPPADIFVDDHWEGIGEWSYVKDNGTYLIRAQLRRYETLYDTISIHSADTAIALHLRPLFGQITVAAGSKDSIYVDGKLLGTESITTEPDNGLHTLLVRKWGYYDSLMSVSVAADTQRISVSLRRVYGSIYVQSVPDGATVYVDGQRRGVTPCEVRGLAMDRHSLRIERSNFAPIVRTFVINGDEPVEMPVFEMVASRRIQQLRDHAKRVQNGFDFAFAFPSMPEVGYRIFIPKAAGLTLELGASCSLQKSATYYIYSPQAVLIGTADYRGIGGYCGLGFGFALKDQCRLTPMVGACHYRLLSSLEGDPARHANGTGLYAGLEAAYIPARHLQFFVRPQYHLPLHRSEAFLALTHHEKYALRLISGLRVKVGINLNF